MADPLSIAAGVIGILTAAAQVSHLLIDFTKNSKDTPQTARTVLTEVNEISGTLSYLQSFLLGNETLDCSRTQLLQVDQVVTVVTGCVLTFSELEELLDTLKTDNIGIRDCIRWVKKENTISSLVQRLQNHKASLSLVLHILNGNTIIEAKNSVDRLHGMIERCYKEMSSRVEALELQDRRPEQNWVHTDDEDDTLSIRTVTGPFTEPPNVAPGSICSGATSAPDYVNSLQHSWVYRRNNALDASRLSVFTRDNCSMAWSCLSGNSWAEVSNISIIGLPILTDEVYNPSRAGRTLSDAFMDKFCATATSDEIASNEHIIVKMPPMSLPLNFLWPGRVWTEISHDRTSGRKISLMWEKNTEIIEVRTEVNVVVDYTDGSDESITEAINKDS